jgi:hypothetical protein
MICRIDVNAQVTVIMITDIIQVKEVRRDEAIASPTNRLDISNITTLKEANRAGISNATIRKAGINRNVITTLIIRVIISNVEVMIRETVTGKADINSGAITRTADITKAEEDTTRTADIIREVAEDITMAAEDITGTADITRAEDITKVAEDITAEDINRVVTTRGRVDTTKVVINKEGLWAAVPICTGRSRNITQNKTFQSLSSIRR